MPSITCHVLVTVSKYWKTQMNGSLKKCLSSVIYLPHKQTSHRRASWFKFSSTWQTLQPMPVEGGNTYLMPNHHIYIHLPQARWEVTIMTISHSESPYKWQAKSQTEWCRKLCQPPAQASLYATMYGERVVALCAYCCWCCYFSPNCDLNLV